MAEEHDIALRSARDRIIDLAEIGDTYPLTDLNVVADQLKVAYGGTAKIPIHNAQAGVVYELRGPKGAALKDEKDKYQRWGEDETLTMETPAVSEDVTYRIRASKPGQPPRLLDEPAPVKVGIDNKLPVSLRSVDPARAPQPSDPSIVRYGESVVVRVSKTQEGVLYSLVIDGIDVPVSNRGDLGDVDLTTPALLDDSVIEVRSTKKFERSENRDDEVTLLDTRLYVKVMANPKLGVAALAPIVDYGESEPAVRVDKSQAKVSYRAYMRLIPDRDFVRGTTDLNVAKVAVEGKDEVKVRTPEPADAGPAPEGYEAVGDAPLAGTGGALKLESLPLGEDAIFIVQATKEHRVGPKEEPLRTSVWLAQAAVVLVRPDPARALELQLPAAGMQVAGGQAGIYYHFRPAPSGKEFERPAYFHKRHGSPPLNKGVGELAVGVDFAIAAPPEGLVGDRGATAPRLPLLDIPALAGGDSLAVRAVKAQTGVEVPLTPQAQIPKLPAIQADPAIVDYGASTKIVAAESTAGLELTLNGATVKLPFETGPLLADTTFVLAAADAAPKGLKVEIVLQLSVLVRPNAGLALSARAESVDKGGATAIVVRGSERGVNYRLVAGSTPIGQAALAGTGGELVLPTGPIAADTTFSVTATRADNAQLATALKAQVTVKVAVPAPPTPPTPPESPAPTPTTPAQ
jgi:hypothetical protein